MGFLKSYDSPLVQLDFLNFLVLEDPVHCPTGYAGRVGDLPGWGTDIGSKLDLSLEDCAERCNGDKTCLSFEHSPTEIKCNLNKIAEPSQGPYLDYIFCTKLTGNCT